MSRVFKSFLAPTIANDFIPFQIASGRWSNSYEKNLSYFDRHCFENYSQMHVLTQEMVDSWCIKRTTETNRSRLDRTGVVRAFIRYLQSRNLTDVDFPEMPTAQTSLYIPHAFTEAELDNFFRACDELPVKPNSMVVLTRKLIVPVIFRLLYSSGIRTTEARLLRTVDVDLDEGVLNIRQSKGYDQHYVALHSTMVSLLRKYENAICVLHPDREFFFPSFRGNMMHTEWVAKNFHKLWYKYNTDIAVSYELRHNYAVENINQWIGLGFDFFSKFVYLSKSMGHKRLQSTRYYYHLVPAMADILLKLTGPDFDWIVPEVDYEEG